MKRHYNTIGVVTCSETKALISFAVTKLICAFGFAYADCWFSHEVAQLYRTNCISNMPDLANWTVNRTGSRLWSPGGGGGGGAWVDPGLGHMTQGLPTVRLG